MDSFFPAKFWCLARYKARVGEDWSNQFTWQNADAFATQSSCSAYFGLCLYMHLLFYFRYTKVERIQAHVYRVDKADCTSSIIKFTQRQVCSNASMCIHMHNLIKGPP